MTASLTLSTIPQMIHTGSRTLNSDSKLQIHIQQSAIEFFTLIPDDAKETDCETLDTDCTYTRVFVIYQDQTFFIYCHEPESDLELNI